MVRPPSSFSPETAGRGALTPFPAPGPGPRRSRRRAGSARARSRETRGEPDSGLRGPPPTASAQRARRPSPCVRSVGPGGEAVCPPGLPSPALFSALLEERLVILGLIKPFLINKRPSFILLCVSTHTVYFCNATPQDPRILHLH